MTTWTWETLTTTDAATLKELMRTGETPDPAASEGRTYEGGLHVAWFVLRHP
jgi:hypothetical protein